MNNLQLTATSNDQITFYFIMNEDFFKTKYIAIYNGLITQNEDQDDPSYSGYQLMGKIVIIAILFFEH